MNWDNYGLYDASSWNDSDSNTWTWNIDHIIPQSLFPYSSMEDDNFKKMLGAGKYTPISK